MSLAIEAAVLRRFPTLRFRGIAPPSAQSRGCGERRQNDGVWRIVAPIDGINILNMTRRCGQMSPKLSERRTMAEEGGAAIDRDNLEFVSRLSRRSRFELLIAPAQTVLRNIVVDNLAQFLLQQPQFHALCAPALPSPQAYGFGRNSPYRRKRHRW